MSKNYIPIFHGTLPEIIEICGLHQNDNNSSSFNYDFYIQIEGYITPFFEEGQKTIFGKKVDCDETCQFIFTIKNTIKNDEEENEVTHPVTIQIIDQKSNKFFKYPYIACFHDGKLFFEWTSTKNNENLYGSTRTAFDFSSLNSISFSIPCILYKCKFSQGTIYQIY